MGVAVCTLREPGVVMAQLLTGKEIVSSMGESLRERVGALALRGIIPALALVRVGNRPDDLSYERTAMRRAESLGLAVLSFVLDEQADQGELESVIAQINANDSIHGCLMFRPLPAHIDEAAVCDQLLARKDIDGITSASLAAVFTGEGEGFPPATAQACLELLDYYGVELEGKRAVVIGRSLVIGKPVAMLLLERNATVTLCHSRSRDLSALCREADIVVCATGRARAYGADFFSEGQVVLDVGINFDAEGKLCGDVDFNQVVNLVGAITPVPGGLGSVTTSVTMEHVVRAAERFSRAIA